MSSTATLVIRSAAPGDTEAVAAIYNQGIAERRATFESGERSAEDAGTWLGRDREPVLVAERDGRVAGLSASSDPPSAVPTPASASTRSLLDELVLRAEEAGCSSTATAP